MDQLWLVAKNAYLKRLKSFSFWALVIGPLLVPIIAIGISYLNVNRDTPKLAVVNEPSLEQALKQEKSIDATISEVASKSEAQKQLHNHDIDAFLTFDNSTEKFQLIATSKTEGKIDETSVRTALTQLLIEKRAAQMHLTSAEVATLLQPAQLSIVTQNAAETTLSETQIGANSHLAIFTVIVIFIFLTLYTGVISQEIANEKSNRIMEILLAVTSSRVQYYGKTLGVMLLALTHIAIYAIGGTALYFGFRGNSVVKQVTSMLAGLNTGFLIFIALMTIIAVVGFLLLASIIASLVNDQSQAQQATQPVVFLSMIGYISSFALASNPSNVVLQVMSFIPFLSPTMMPTRFANLSVGAGEAWIALLLQVIAVGLVAYFGERVYSRNVLSYSEGNLIRQLFRNIRWERQGSTAQAPTQETKSGRRRSLNQRLGIRNRLIIAGIIIIVVLIRLYLKSRS
ncbi:ABC transporter permease [Pullulanibacillus sp. KACC 23026]|uniref:ABC transporter permease n=1 Tax=Pullulanibacillus sp. KACC 23026 TaxID=3028315 RepID=UPI0023AF7E87|nr:ABC transporter permease [Pullulanibacillus sp. KACC 23026]WEG14835.1 ABC transporter permease [Pullulanibacillus sp. KACC 23026]